MVKLLTVLGASMASVAYATAPQSIVDTVVADPNLSTLESIVTDMAYSGVLSALSGLTDGTLFAPTDAAFAALGVDCLDAANTALCTSVLQYHVEATTAFYSADLPAATTTYITALEDQFLGVNTRSGVVVENGMTAAGERGSASVITTTAGSTFDVNCTNGVIHTIDAVMLPPSSVSESATRAGFTQLVAALTKANLVGTVDASTFTVFAPTDAAFNAIPWVDRIDVANLDKLLKHHLVGAAAFSSDLSDGQNFTSVNGNQLTVDLTSGVAIGDNNGGSANVVAPFDVITDQKGAWHSIDAVLVPADFVSPPERTLWENMQEISELDDLTGLIADARYSAVKDILDDPTNTLTLFAPNNAAIQTLLGAIDCTANANVDACIATLQLHLLTSTVAAGDLAPGNNPVPTALANGTFATLPANEFQYIVVNENQGAVSIGDASVVTADVDCSNGVIHIVDAAIPLPELTSTTAQGAGLTELTGALTSAGLVGAVDVDNAGITVFAPVNQGFTNVNKYSRCFTTQQLTDVLTYHVVASRAFSTDLTDGQVIPTLNGGDLTVGINNGVYTLTDAAGRVSTINLGLVDITTKNGVVHVIDEVVVPAAPTPCSIFGIVEDSASHTTLTAVLNDAQYSSIKAILDTDAATNTLFAPTDAAFDGVDCINTLDCTDILTYHLIQATALSSSFADGNNVRNTALTATDDNIAQAVGVNKDGNTFTVFTGEQTLSTTITIGPANLDDNSGNSIVHVVDTILMPPSITSATATAAGLDTLVANVIATNITSTINDGGELTIFAPTDAAFTAIDSFTSCLALDVIETVLGYHVVAGRTWSDMLTVGTTPLNSTIGVEFNLTVAANGDVTLTDANGDESAVVITDVITQNAAVHVIDAVILPVAVDECSSAATTGATVLSVALIAALSMLFA